MLPFKMQVTEENLGAIKYLTLLQVVQKEKKNKALTGYLYNAV